MGKLPYIVYLVLFVAFVLADGDVVHFSLNRRGGRFARRGSANLTSLTDLLQTYEAWYKRTIRKGQGNKLVREWRSKDNRGTHDAELISAAGHDGRWYSASCKFTLTMPVFDKT